MEHPNGKGQGKGDPNTSPDPRLFCGDDVRFAIKKTEIDSEDREHNDIEGDPRRNTSGEAQLPFLQCVADIQENFEIQLLSTIGKVERSHLGLIAGGFGALKSFAVHLIEVRKDAVAGTGHSRRFRTMDRRVVIPEPGDFFKDLLGVTVVKQELLCGAICKTPRVKRSHSRNVMGKRVERLSGKKVVQFPWSMKVDGRQLLLPRVPLSDVPQRYVRGALA
jgi:hypothetical protein